VEQSSGFETTWSCSPESLQEHKVETSSIRDAFSSGSAYSKAAADLL
jgi:hypothetical protein